MGRPSAWSTDPNTGVTLGGYVLTGGPGNAGPSNTAGDSLDTTLQIGDLDNTTTVTGPAGTVFYQQAATFTATVASTQWANNPRLRWMAP